MHVLTLAFEGINGTGKSHVIHELHAALDVVPHNRVHIAKIGGLGEGQRMDCLRTILASRETKLVHNELSQKELKDYQRDIIFRLAYRYQTRQLLATDITAFTHVLLDRTPLMSWAYTAAAFPDNPYIGEVRGEAIEYSGRLGIQWLYWT